MKIGFANAVRARGDRWLFADELDTARKGPRVSASTWIAMRESKTDSEARSALTMELCTKHGKLFQLEQPIYRCGCNGLCSTHPECPGAVYDANFPYRNDK